MSHFSPLTQFIAIKEKRSAPATLNARITKNWQQRKVLLLPLCLEGFLSRCEIPGIATYPLCKDF